MTEHDRLTKLQKEIVEFRDERDWEQFHTPKNLSMAISIEASELMEHFLWKNDQELTDELEGEKLEEIKDEIADIFIFNLLMADSLDIDVAESIREKLEKNKKKYPKDKVKGKAKKYTEL